MNNLPMTATAQVKPRYSMVQPLWKFSLLCFFSAGIYLIHWFYVNWRLVRELDRRSFSPGFRAFFSGIFAYPLFKRLLKLAMDSGYQGRYSPLLLALFYLLLPFGIVLPFPFNLIGFFFFLPVLPVVKALNYYWATMQPEMKVRKNLSGREILFLAICFLYFILRILFKWFRLSQSSYYKPF